MSDFMDPIASYNDSAEAKGWDPIPTWDQIDDYRKARAENPEPLLKCARCGKPFPAEVDGDEIALWCRDCRESVSLTLDGFVALAMGGVL